MNLLPACTKNKANGQAHINFLIFPQLLSTFKGEPMKNTQQTKEHNTNTFLLGMRSAIATTAHQQLKKTLTPYVCQATDLLQAKVLLQQAKNLLQDKPILTHYAKAKQTLDQEIEFLYKKEIAKPHIVTYEELQTLQRLEQELSDVELQLRLDLQVNYEKFYGYCNVFASNSTTHPFDFDEFCQKFEVLDFEKPIFQSIFKQHGIVV